MSIGAWTSFKRSWRYLTAMQIATMGVLMGSFIVLSIALVVHQNMQRMLAHWGQEVKVNVYLQEEIGAGETQIVAQFLEESKLFSNVQYITKKEAVEKFKKRLGQYVPGLLSDLEFDNPLPASFEMAVAGGLNSKTQFDYLMKIVAQIKKISGVDEVSYGQGWVENYASVLKAFSLTSAVFIFALLAGSLFVIGNSISHSISQRRDEIEILELCGATRKMIVWPFIFEGLMMGFLAAVFAVMVAYALYFWQIDVIADELSFWNIKTEFEFLSASRLLLIVGLGTVIGGCGSYVWARQVTTGWAAAEAAPQ